MQIPLRTVCPQGDLSWRQKGKRTAIPPGNLAYFGRLFYNNVDNVKTALPCLPYGGQRAGILGVLRKGGVRMEQEKHPVLGILGGLGPAASCYLYQMLIDHTPAQRDQDHIDLVLSSRASTPDRTAFITGQSSEDPFTIMEQDGRSLVRYGATVLAIPCNTAHYFYDRLAAALPVPVLNMPRLTVKDAAAAGCRRLGILATDGTIQAQTYQIACQEAGMDWAVPAPKNQQGIMSIIYDQIKKGHRADMTVFNAAAQDLAEQGCDFAVLGCTELSLVKRDEHLGPFFIDSTEVLCRYALLACGVTPIGLDPPQKITPASF